MGSAVPSGQGTTLEAQLLNTIKHCWSAVFSSTLRRTLPDHLTPQQVSVLAHLGHGTCQPSALARESHVGMSAMTGVIDGLVMRGLVARRPDPHDRRAVRLEITEAGQAVYEEARAMLVATVQQLLAPLTAAQRERLAAALADLESVLDQEAVLAGKSGDGPLEAAGPVGAPAHNRGV